MYITKNDYVGLIQKNPILLAGFLNCVGNLIIFFTLKKDINSLKINNNINVIKIKILFNIGALVCLFNFPALISLIIGCVKTFKWDRVVFCELKECFIKEKKVHITYACTLLLIILCYYWIAFSFR